MDAAPALRRVGAPRPPEGAALRGQPAVGDDPDAVRQAQDQGRRADADVQELPGDPGRPEAAAQAPAEVGPRSGRFPSAGGTLLSFMDAESRPLFVALANRRRVAYNRLGV